MGVTAHELYVLRERLIQIRNDMLDVLRKLEATARELMNCLSQKNLCDARRVVELTNYLRKYVAWLRKHQLEYILAYNQFYRVYSEAPEQERRQYLEMIK